MLNKLLCNHQWKILSETTTESAFEMSLRSLKDSGATKTNIPWQLADGDRKHIVVVCCDKCGKIKKYSTNL